MTEVRESCVKRPDGTNEVRFEKRVGWHTRILAFVGNESLKDLANKHRQSAVAKLNKAFES